MSKPDDCPTLNPVLQLDEVLEQQRRCWSRGERILVESFLEKTPALGLDQNLLLDLLYNEIVQREKSGERPNLEEYTQRFPDLRAELALQFEVDHGLNWQMLDNASAPVSATDPTLQPALGFTAPIPSLPGYGIQGLLGRGATGVVYKARQLKEDRSVAVKVVLAGLRRPAHALAQLQAEAAVLARQRHPHFCPIHEIGMSAGRLFIAQERVEASLANRRSQAPVTPQQAAAWVETLAHTVESLHQLGIVHGSLSPANVLVSYSGTLKITDIGLARHVSSGVSGNAGAIMRSHVPAHARRNTGELDPAADVFGLGLILYELLSGHPPLRAASGQTDDCDSPIRPPHLPDDMPRDLDAICQCCLGAQGSGKYESAQAVAEDLKAFLAGTSIQAQRPGYWKRMTAKVERWRARLTPSGSSARQQEVRRASLAHRLRAERLQRAHDLTCSWTRIKRQEELLPVITESVSWLVRAEETLLFLVNRERGEVWARIDGPTGLEELRLPLDFGAIGTAISTGKPVSLAASVCGPDIVRTTGCLPRNLLAMPLVNSDGAVLGVIQAINKETGEFDAEDIESLRPVLTGATVAIERSETSEPEA